MKKNNKKGFTLVELVIVVAVMAVLVAVAIPTVGSILGTAKDAVAESNARTIESVIKLAEANAANDAEAGEGVVTVSLTAEKMAKAVYEGKLGITSADDYYKFTYDPDTGAVAVGESDALWTIVFGENGEVTVTPVGDDAGGAKKWPADAE